MSDTNSANPFVLPGMGQSSDLSGNPLLASMEMMRQAWAGLAGPGGLAQVLPMGSPMNIEELERRIAELRAVESWLRMNLSMLDSTIQGMEVQRATIATLRSFVDKMSSVDTSASSASGGPSPLEVVLGLKPDPAKKTADKKAAPKTESGDAAQAAGAESAASPFNAAAQSASQAWWGLLQQQFNNIAAATTATMSGSQPDASSQPKPESAQPAAANKAPAKPARKKPAARKPAEPSSP
jgi:hypothetical protein